MAYKNAKKNSAHVRELHKRTGVGTCKVRHIHKHSGVIPTTGRTLPRAVGINKISLFDKIMSIFS